MTKWAFSLVTTLAHFQFAAILVINFGAIAQKPNISYTWVQFNDRFDCVAGISVNGTPVGAGVFISTRTLLTSANPIKEHMMNTKAIQVHTISKRYNESRTRAVKSVAGNQSFRDKNWVNVGHDGKHSTIHDILLITLADSDKIDRRNATKHSEKNRRPFPIDLPLANGSFYPPAGAVFAGFGYVDENHVSDNKFLEVSYYEDSAFADCDEWMPREWGRFICLVNVEQLLGVASGMPLFLSTHMTTVLGIGSFVLQKGDESVLVFTDLRPYVNYLYGDSED